MRNLDEELNKSPHTFFIKTLSIPRVYIADSINDFIQNSESIKPTNRLIIPDLFGLHFFNGAIIELPKVTFSWYEPEYFESLGKISDIKGDSLDVICNGKRGEMGLGPKKYALLEEGMTLHNPRIFFNTKNKKVWLFDYQPNGPQSKEKSSESEYEPTPLTYQYI